MPASKSKLLIDPIFSTIDRKPQNHLGIFACKATHPDKNILSAPFVDLAIAPLIL